MPTDFSTQVRQSIVAALKAYAPLTAIVSASRIYGERADPKTQWPFVRYGLSISGAYEAQGLDGSEHQVTIHAFHKGPFTDQVNLMARHIVACLGSLASFSGEVMPLDIQWTGTNTVTDTDEPDGYHAIIQFSATAVEYAT